VDPKENEEILVIVDEMDLQVQQDQLDQGEL
jgi:hypothetical protein